MALYLERSNSLCDIRRTQRRVAALILCDNHVELLRYPLRKRVLPQGFCYVCSRVDPGGVFKNPHSHLFKKGFFNTCEHFPQAPFTTFVRDDGPILPKRDDTLTDLATNRTAAPSISVTIRKGSRSTNFKSPTKNREGALGSSISGVVDTPTQTNFNDNQSIHSVATHQTNQTNNTNQEAGRITIASETKSPFKVDVLRAPSQTTAKTRRSKRSLPQTVQSSEKPEPIATPNDKITIPTGRDDAESSVSGLSSFTENSSPTKTAANDLNSTLTSRKDSESLYRSKMNMFLSAPVDSPRTTSARSSALQIGPYINPSDGLQDQFVADPLIREVVMLNISEDPHSKRSKRRLPSIPTDRTSARSNSTYRPGSGHLRYHHRIDEDSLPFQGFELPPTPSDDLLLSDQRSLPSDSMFDSGSSKGAADSSINDDASLHITDKTPGAKSRHSRLSSDRHSFCRCATGEREISFVRNVCRNCGKACTCESGSRVTSKTRQPTGNDTAGSSSRRSLSQRMDYLQPGDSRMNARSKPYTDEDYMDLNSIIHEDDGHYFSGDDADNDSDESPLTWYRNPHPYPMFDPDIHKKAYLKALKEARLRDILLTDELDLEKSPSLRRSTVFSYIPNLPYKGKDAKQPEYLGLRPDDSVRPKKGQYMKHIFGNVNPDDFYPGGPVVSKSKVIIDSDRTKDSGTEKVLTERTDPKDALERSSVSLKMRKSVTNLNQEV